MAWTTPRTWVPGELVTASMMNTHLRDNLNALKASFAAVCQGRLTLATGTPVTMTDQTAKTTLYFTPYGGNLIALYDGSAWNNRTFAELSIAVPATTSTMYDVFVYDNAGSPALELLAWTNDTTRATALATQDGVLCKTGALTRRYIGSFRTTTVAGQTEDSAMKRYVWNYCNRRRRPFQRYEPTGSWTYDTNAWRQANNSTANQVDVVIGMSEDVVVVNLDGRVNVTVTGAQVAAAIGLDALTLASNVVGGELGAVLSDTRSFHAQYSGFPGVGRHYFPWIERSGGGANGITWYGSSLPYGVGEQSGLTGWSES